MRFHLCVVGRLRHGAERDLVIDYLERFNKIGRALNLGPIQLHEVESKKSTMKDEAILLRRVIPKGALMVTLDERGKVLSSPEFSKILGKFRDQGRSDLAFIIGGADGISPDLRAEADYSLSFGKMVWPHMLVRVMIAEQLYRAASIQARSPYHRV